MADQDQRDIAQQRLCSHGLAGAPFAGITEVVGWLGAAQSQEYAVAKWSVGQRATGLSDAALDRAMSASYYRQHGLDDAAFARSNALLAGVLRGGNQLTRKEVAAAMADAGVATDNPTVGFLPLHAELEQVVCSGALNGRQRTYALFDDRVPPAPAVDRDEALAGLTRRYFTSHGPATRADYQWWSSLTAAVRHGRFVGLPTTLAVSDA